MGINTGKPVVATDVEVPLSLEESSTSTSAILELENSNSATDKPALMQLNRSSTTVADDMEIGEIKFVGKSAGGSEKEYASILALASDVTSSAESGEMRFFALVNNTLTECIRIGKEDSGEIPAVPAFALQVNAGIADLDFIVSGDGAPNLIRTFAGEDRVGVGNVPTSTSAVLSVNSTTKGFLPPRMTTTEQNAISSPDNGLVIYNTTTNKLMVYNGAWTALH